nr:hypothetical protein [Tanacetum cinerariifolium]
MKILKHMTQDKAKVAKSDKKKQPKKMPKAKGLDVLSKGFLMRNISRRVVQMKELVLYQGFSMYPYTNLKVRKSLGGDSGEEDDDDDENDSTKNKEEDVDERVHTPLDYELTDDEKIHDEENINDEERIDEEKDDEVTKELYKDVEVNLGNVDTEMTNADQGGSGQQNVSQESGFVQEKEDTHLLNLENPSLANNKIASLMETLACHAIAVLKITSSFTTTIPPPPPFFNLLLQQATPNLTPTNSKTTTLFPSLPDFSSVFRFNDKVTNLEKYMSEIKQVDQYAQAISLIPAIVDRYMDDKLGEAIHKAIQSHNAECREEAQVKKREYIHNVDSTLRTIIREEVND